MIFDLKGHVALVTGGNGGLGLAMARGLAKAGASIAVWGRNAEKNQTALADLALLDADAAAFACDVMDEGAIARAMEATLARFGRVDSCFANAGGPGARGPFTSLTAEQWSQSQLLNIGSVVSTFQAATRHFVTRGGGGKLIVTSSIAGEIGIPMASPYSTTKAAVAGLVRALAVELGPKGIQANAILPGFIETELSLDTPRHFQDAARRRACSGEIGRLEDMEGIAVYLASKESRFMTGQALVIDGGHCIFPM